MNAPGAIETTTTIRIITAETQNSGRWLMSRQASRHMLDGVSSTETASTTPTLTSSGAATKWPWPGRGALS